MENFLIVKLSSLGDIIHTLPSFHAIRTNFPEARINWIVERNGQEILDLVPGIDKIIGLKKSKFNKEKSSLLKELLDLRNELKNTSQIALDFQGLLKSSFIAFISGAKKRIGFHRENLKEPAASIFYNDHFEPIPENIHVIKKNLLLLNRIGIEEDRYVFPLVLPQELSEAVDNKLRNTGFNKNKKLILCNVGAAWKTKRWFAQKWIKLLSLLDNKNLFPLLLWGTEQEKDLASEISAKCKTPVSPYFSIKEVMSLIQKSNLLISGDTYALHAACALSKPAVAIIGPTNPERNGPFGPNCKIAFHKLKCSYCYKKTCRTLDCLKAISPEEVYKMSIQLLEHNE